LKGKWNKVKIAGIIAEYNPFHNGHAYHIIKTKELGYTHIIVVMSGNYTQRGEPAIMRKDARYRAALASGADLIIELPLPWATASAEGFAFGAVHLLNALGCVDALSFGSECSNIKQIEQCAVKLEDINNNPELHTMLKKGFNFPKARQLAFNKIHGDFIASPLLSPNDLLGVEYVKALIKTNSDILPLTIERLNVKHDASYTADNFASATYIRTLMKSDENNNAFKYVPVYAEEIYKAEIEKGLAPFNFKAFEGHLLSYLRRLDKIDFLQFDDVNEGLENRIYEAVKNATDLQELYDYIKTKRYTMSRIRRIILSSFLNNRKGYRQLKPPYLRCMGFNDKGLNILKAAKKSAALPIITRYRDIKQLGEYSSNIFELESHSTDLYNLCLTQSLKCGTEKLFSLIK
jgi:predicted nucleotidyltransferase